LLRRQLLLPLQSQQRDVPQQASTQDVDAQQELLRTVESGSLSAKQKHTQQNQQQPDPQQRRGPLRWLRRNVSRLPFFAKAGEGQQTRLDIRAVLQQLRVVILGCMMGCVLLVVRFSLLHQARTAPREVLYSDFVALLDAGKVKTARLEAASSRVLFEVHPQDAAASATTAAGAKGSKAAAASSKGSSAAAAATASAQAAAARPPPSKRFFIKLADKQDPLLVGKVLQAGRGALTAAPAQHQQRCPSTCTVQARPCRHLRTLGHVSAPPMVLPHLFSHQTSPPTYFAHPTLIYHAVVLCCPVLSSAGVEFAVVRASFQQQLQQMLLTMFALWIPLLPLLLLVFRAMDSRNGTAARRRNKNGPNTPRVTFADVAGESPCLGVKLTLNGPCTQRQQQCMSLCRCSAQQFQQQPSLMPVQQ
jgi:hypothetical protein